MNPEQSHLPSLEQEVAAWLESEHARVQGSLFDTGTFNVPGLRTGWKAELKCMGN